MAQSGNWLGILQPAGGQFLPPMRPETIGSEKLKMVDRLSGPSKMCASARRIW
jgi:hypothetical protein